MSKAANDELEKAFTVLALFELGEALKAKETAARRAELLEKVNKAIDGVVAEEI